MKYSGKEISFIEAIDVLKQRQCRRKADMSYGTHYACKNGRPNRMSEVDKPTTLRTYAVRTLNQRRAVLPVQLSVYDLMKKKYRNKHQTKFLFLLDTSRSQGAFERISYAKGAIMRLLSKAYCDREKVGLVIFGDKKTDYILPFTKSVELAADKLEQLTVKGNTPLGMGMREAIKIILRERQLFPDNDVILVAVTDGKVNYDELGGDPLDLVLKEARTIKVHNIPLLVLNTESGIFSTGITKKIAEYAGALYTEIR